MPSLGAGEPQNGAGTLVRWRWYETEHLAPTQVLHIPKAGGAHSPDAGHESDADPYSQPTVEAVHGAGGHGEPPSAARASRLRYLV